MRPQMHMSKVHPAEKWRFCFGLFCNPFLCGGCELVVAGLHSFFCKRAGIFNLLLAYAPPARLYGRVILVCSKAMQHATRPKILAEVWEVLGAGIVRQLRLFFGIEV